MSVIVKIKNRSGEHQIKLADNPFTIGRSSNANLTLEDDTLSRVHCFLYLHSGIATIKDNNSKNGISRNGSSVKEHHIYLGDKIEIGNTIIQLLADKMTSDEKRLHRRL